MLRKSFVFFPFSRTFFGSDFTHLYNMPFRPFCFVLLLSSLVTFAFFSPEDSVLPTEDKKWLLAELSGIIAFYFGAKAVDGIRGGNGNGGTGPGTGNNGS